MCKQYEAISLNFVLLEKDDYSKASRSIQAFIFVYLQITKQNFTVITVAQIPIEVPVVNLAISNLILGQWKHIF